MTGIVATPTATVSMPVEELAKLVKHADNSLFFHNLRRESPSEFHRCVEIRMLDFIVPEIEFVLTSDNNRIATVRHKLDDIFDLLPRLRNFLENYRVEVVTLMPSMTQETMIDLHALLTGIRISEPVSDGVNDFIGFLDKEIVR